MTVSQMRDENPRFGLSVMKYNIGLSKFQRPAGYATRLTAAAVLALVLAQVMQVRLPLWVVLTAIVVTQTSVGRSLKVTLDYFAGTLFGVVWGGAVAILMAPSGEASLILALVLGLAPLAFATTWMVRYSAAPITAAIVILVPQIVHVTPIESALERLIEVALGGLAGLIVSLVVLPSSAFGLVREQAGQVIESIATAAELLFNGLKRGLGTEEARQLQSGIAPLLNQLSEVANEAERERLIRFGGDPSIGPLVRSTMRLRHDLVIIGRASSVPLPEPLLEALEPSITAVGVSITEHLHACASSLRYRRPAPSLEEVVQSAMNYSKCVDAARQRYLFRDLSASAVEHVFAIGFAVEQIRRDLQDLDRCVDQWAGLQT